jgi:uncharacterized protein (DUF433 family)
VIQTTAYRYIVTNELILSGEPIIKGTRTPVRAIVELWRQGVSPELIPSQLPYLTLAQVFDALSYYSDNQEQVNSYIERNRIPEDSLFADDAVVTVQTPPAQGQAGVKPRQATVEQDDLGGAQQ